MKKIFKIILCILLVIIQIPFASCRLTGEKYYYWSRGYKTKYSPEEHIDRLTDIVENKYRYEIKVGGLISYEIYNIYAFSDKEQPSCFMIEYEWKNYDFYEKGDDYNGYAPDVIVYSHNFGFIENDKYKIIYEDGLLGKSYLKSCGATKKGVKMYYASSAYQVYPDGSIICAYEDGEKVKGAQYIKLNIPEEYWKSEIEMKEIEITLEKEFWPWMFDVYKDIGIVFD